MIIQQDFYRKSIRFKITTSMFIAICILFIHIPKSKSDNYMYISLKNMEPLVGTEGFTIRMIKSSLPQVNDTSARSKIEKFLKSSIKEYVEATKDIQHYLGNPINAFRLIKRLYVDLIIIEDMLKDNPYYTRSDKDMYPTIEDLDGASKGLIHLIVIYNLNITELANGTFITNVSRSKKSFVEYVTPMTASDCYELGVAAAEYQEHAISIALMTAAFNKYQDCDVCSFTEFDIVKFMSRTYYVMGKTEDFLRWTEKSMKLKLTDQQIKENKHLIEHLKKTVKKNRPEKSKTVSTKRNNEAAAYYSNMLCLEETNKTINNKSLHCFYKIGPQPFIRLLSFKVEQLHLGPDVTMIHDVITDKEIDAFKRDVGPRLEMGTVNTNFKSANHRVVGIAWIFDFTSKVPARVSLRLSLITGYPVHSSQPLEICNFGIGGFFAPHVNVKENFTIPRICLKNNLTVVNPADWQEMVGRATGYMFLSHVEQGGAIIFVRLGLTVFPKKGAVVIWNNLRLSGRSDYRIIHADCPVLRGNKWTAIKLL